MICKSYLSASFTAVFKEITSIPLFIASFPIFTAIGAFIQNKKQKATSVHNTEAVIASPYLQLAFQSKAVCP